MIKSIMAGFMITLAAAIYLTVGGALGASVASFILLGANHCVADMAYMFLAADPKILLPTSAALLCTTAGNIIGCNLIPYSQ